MDQSQIAQEIKKLKPKAHKRFVENLLIVLGQVQRSVVLRGPYRLIVDSNILMRFESYRSGTISEGLLSILLAFEFIKRLPFHIDIVVRPVVFHEFLRLKQLSSTREHWEKFKGLKSLVEDALKVTLFFDGIETYAGAEYYGKLIENDADKIITTLRSYQDRDWKFDFVRNPGGFDGALLKNGQIEVPPLFAARSFYEPLGLKYFDEQKASRFFIEHIEKHIIECDHNDKRVISKYSRDDQYLLTKVLKMSSKGNLVGLADIDILTLCNVQTQFTDQAQGRYFPASIGMSIDENLSKALKQFSTIHLSSSQMLGGQENMEDNLAKIEAFGHDQKRFQDGEARERLALDIARTYLGELNSIGIFCTPTV